MMTNCENCELKDYCISDECIWYEEQSSDEAKEFLFWFNR